MCKQKNFTNREQVMRADLILFSIFFFRRAHSKKLLWNTWNITFSLNCTTFPLFTNFVIFFYFSGSSEEMPSAECRAWNANVYCAVETMGIKTTAWICFYHRLMSEHSATTHWAWLRWHSNIINNMVWIKCRYSFCLPLWSTPQPPFALTHTYTPSPIYITWEQQEKKKQFLSLSEELHASSLSLSQFPH